VPIRVHPRLTLLSEFRLQAVTPPIPSFPSVPVPAIPTPPQARCPLRWQRNSHAATSASSAPATLTPRPCGSQCAGLPPSSADGDGLSAPSFAPNVSLATGRDALRGGGRRRPHTLSDGPSPLHAPASRQNTKLGRATLLRSRPPFACFVTSFREALSQLGASILRRAWEANFAVTVLSPAATASTWHAAEAGTRQRPPLRCSVHVFPARLGGGLADLTGHNMPCAHINSRKLAPGLLPNGSPPEAIYVSR